MAKGRVFVIDASTLLVAWLPKEPYRAHADALFHCYEEEQVELCGPTLLPYEILNGLYVAVRGKAGQAPRLSRKEALEAWELFQKLGIRLEKTDHLSERLLKLALEYQRPSIYDMTYVALAEHLKSPLITADRRLLGAPKGKLDWVIPLWE